MQAMRTRSLLQKDTTEFGVRETRVGEQGAQANKENDTDADITIQPRSCMKRSCTNDVGLASEPSVVSSISKHSERVLRSGTSLFSEPSVVSSISRTTLIGVKRKALLRAESNVSWLTVAESTLSGMTPGSGDDSGPSTPKHYMRAGTKVIDEPVKTRSQLLLTRLRDAGTNITRMFASIGPPCIIFEWDDLLCPTWFLQKYVCPKPGEALGNSRFKSLEKVFDKHASVVRKLLFDARKVGHICIVTTATETWFNETLTKYLKPLEFDDLAAELDIEVCHVEASTNRVDLVESKQDAMNDCLLKYYGSANCAWNVISISSSTIEQDALKKCMRGARSRRFCKTVKVSSKMKVEKLTVTLASLGPQLGEWARRKKDIDTFHFVADT